MVNVSRTRQPSPGTGPASWCRPSLLRDAARLPTTCQGRTQPGLRDLGCSPHGGPKLAGAEQRHGSQAGGHQRPGRGHSSANTAIPDPTQLPWVPRPTPSAAPAAGPSGSPGTVCKGVRPKLAKRCLSPLKAMTREVLEADNEEGQEWHGQSVFVHLLLPCS